MLCPLIYTFNQFHTNLSNEELAWDSHGMVRSELSATECLPAMKLAIIKQSMPSTPRKNVGGV